MYNNIYFKEKRKKIGLSQKEFATLLEITPKYLSDIENGRSTPSKKLQKKIKNKFYYYEYNRNKNKKITEEAIPYILGDNNLYNKIAQTTRELIEINKLLEEKTIKILSLIDNNNPILIKKINRPLITTIKNLEHKKNIFEEMLTNKIIKIKE